MRSKTKTTIKKASVTTVILLGFLLIAHSAFVIGAERMQTLELVTDSHGFKLYLGPYPTFIEVGSSGTMHTFIFAGDPKPQAYFQIFIDGVLVNHGYGSARANVVEFFIPIDSNNYAIGRHSITSSVVVSSLGISNPAFSNTLDFDVVPVGWKEQQQTNPDLNYNPPVYYTPTPNPSFLPTATPLPSPTQTPNMDEPVYVPNDPQDPIVPAEEPLEPAFTVSTIIIAELIIGLVLAFAGFFIFKKL